MNLLLNAARIALVLSLSMAGGSAFAQGAKSSDKAAPMASAADAKNIAVDAYLQTKTRFEGSSTEQQVVERSGAIAG